MAECSPTGDFTPARELGARVSAARERIAELTAQLASAVNAEDKRKADEAAAERVKQIKACRAHLGAWKAGIKELDRCIGDIAHWHRKTYDAMTALAAVMPKDVGWPPGFHRFLPNAVTHGVRAAIGECPAQPTVIASIEPFRIFIRDRLREMAKAANLPPETSNEE